MTDHKRITTNTIIPGLIVNPPYNGKAQPLSIMSDRARIYYPWIHKLFNLNL
jgi:hypothetical protein